MTRTEYLNQLEAYLMKLPQADRIEAMDYFKELFDDAGPEGEEELMASLGSPKEAAHDILTTLLDKKSTKKIPIRTTVRFYKSQSSHFWLHLLGFQSELVFSWLSSGFLSLRLVYF
ncbi:hypothetical protein HMPREF9954_0183 [Streptococcus infantis SK970]|nr:hypothetical protein HMPREF9954_0183 [Streptococcus infantis SK970]